MKNIVTNELIDRFSQIISSSERIAIISHTNPDGDAIGSGLALLRMLQKLGHPNVRFIVPNHFPQFLAWMDPAGDVEIFADNVAETTAYLSAADLIIIADFNDTRRLERMSEALDRNISAVRVLVDHHIAPPQYDLSFHSTDSSSTALIVYHIVKGLGIDIDRSLAEALYTGIMTDTGGFSFGNLSGDLFRAVGDLADAGVDAPLINRTIFNNQSESRVRMVGYLLDRKLNVMAANHAAYITLTRAEKQRFNHRIGDTEGVVNIPLTIEGVDFSAILVENQDHVKISLRSVGDKDVNVICREYFSGGGHKNAAGGKFFGTIEETEKVLLEVISKM